LAAIAADHDPLDVFRVDLTAYRLLPLVYSPGRNETSGLNSEEDYVTWPNWIPVASLPGMAFSAMAPHITSPRLTPYVADGDSMSRTSPDELFGSDNGQEAATDNVHNHLVGRRL
jgi:hypothetical protein